MHLVFVDVCLFPVFVIAAIFGFIWNLKVQLRQYQCRVLAFPGVLIRVTLYLIDFIITILPGQLIKDILIILFKVLEYIFVTGHHTLIYGYRRIGFFVRDLFCF